MNDSSASDRDDAALHSLLRAIAARDRATTLRLLAESPTLARRSVVVGASRNASAEWFLEDIAHHVYAGDTPLHVAAAAYSIYIVNDLLERNARVRAANRRGAEPLHYASDGAPGSARWRPDMQFAVIKALLDAGADPDAGDMDGATPLHRAVRTRCAEGVRALLENGAHARVRNKAGSTPLHLAVRNTGRGGTGSQLAREQQRRIIELLLSRGARVSDQDSNGKTVAEGVTSGWIKALLASE